MNKNLEQFVIDLVNTSKLNSQEKNLLSKELISHISEKERELEIQGLNEEKIEEKIKSLFGDPQRIANEITLAHQSPTLALSSEIILLIFSLIIGFLFLFGGRLAITINYPPPSSSGSPTDLQDPKGIIFSR